VAPVKRRRIVEDGESRGREAIDPIAADRYIGQSQSIECRIRIERSMVRRNTLRQWIPFIVWVALIFVVSSIPRLSGEVFGMPRGSDKAAHFIEYAILAFLFYRGERGERWRMGVPAWLLVIAAGLAIALIDEYHQRYIPGRDSNILDLAADAAGIVSGTLIGMRRYKMLGRRAEKA
jgi:hypothetical protein